jgi:hypothetical protein
MCTAFGTGVLAAGPRCMIHTNNGLHIAALSLSACRINMLLASGVCIVSKSLVCKARGALSLLTSARMQTRPTQQKLSTSASVA